MENLSRLLTLNIVIFTHTAGGDLTAEPEVNAIKPKQHGGHDLSKI